MMHNFLRRAGLLLSLHAAFFLAPAVMAEQSDLQVSIQPVENGVEFVLTNTSTEAVSFLSWETPLESELTQDIFVITPSDGGNRNLYARPAVFSGKLFKRGDPRPKD